MLEMTNEDAFLILEVKMPFYKKREALSGLFHLSSITACMGTLDKDVQIIEVAPYRGMIKEYPHQV